MSIVSVHGPNTMFTTQGGGETISSSGGGVATATKDPTNGLKFSFSIPNPGARPAADFDWTFTGPGSPVAQPNLYSGTVTFTGAGAVTIVCTVAAGAGPPAGGTYTITAAATAGTPRFAEEEPMSDSTPYASGQEGAVPPPVEEPTHPEVPVAVDLNPDVAPDPETRNVPADPAEPAGEALDESYDPGEHTVAEVTEYAENLDADGVKALIAKEEAGKNRTTLVSGLNEFLPFDPGDWTVDEVKDYVLEYPEEREAALEAEKAGKNRTTLVTWLETPPEDES